jgi:uroporphyrinogen decarboxylase
MGVSNFLLGMKLEPDATHKLLRITTKLVKDWLNAQAEALTKVESILVLDDIAGFMSPRDYQEFAHPYLKEIFDAFPVEVKMFHNDTDNPASFKFLPDLGIHVFNFTHLQPLAKVRDLVGPDLCLFGNVPPVEVLTKGAPDDVRRAVCECLSQHPSPKGLILSAGGGTSPGTPGVNIHALSEAVGV